jgi:hypothetical protein
MLCSQKASRKPWKMSMNGGTDELRDAQGAVAAEHAQDHRERRH